jgi:hypothetical protein
MCYGVPQYVFWFARIVALLVVWLPAAMPTSPIDPFNLNPNASSMKIVVPLQPEDIFPAADDEVPSTDMKVPPPLVVASI